MSFTGPDLQPRDLQLFFGLMEAQLMTAAHAATLHFSGRKDAAKKRLQKLKKAGFILERRRRVYQPAVLTLAKRGFLALQTSGLLMDTAKFTSWKRAIRSGTAESFVRHQLALLDFKVAMVQSLRTDDHHALLDFILLQHSPRTARHSNHPRQNSIIPDAFIRIQASQSKADQVFFLQIDRTHESLNRLVQRIDQYRHYYQTGTFAHLHGAKREDYRKYPFRVLYLFSTSRRRNNAIEHLLTSRPNILRLVWSATLKEVTGNPLGAVWITPMAYRAALRTQNTTSGNWSMGHSHAARDAEIEKAVVKQHLLTP